MKKNQLKHNIINILFSLTTLLFFSLNINAQVDLDINNKVGIGTTTPASKLDVEGGISVGATYSGTTASPANGAIIEGNVGIGTTSASSKLSISSGGSNDGVRVTKTSTTAASLYLTASTGNQWALFSKGTGNSYPGDFSIYDLTGGRDRLVIKPSTGSVGIGTVVPAAKLEVKSDNLGALSNNLILSNIPGASTANGTSLAFNLQNNLNTVYNFGRITVTSSDNTSPSEDGTMGFDVMTNGATNARVMTLKDGNVGIGTSIPTASLHVSSATGFLLNGPFAGSGTQTYVSDQQFKTNIDSISNALSLIDQLKPRSFYFDTTNVYGLNFSNLKQFGLIAQDVEQILPELVTSITKPADVDTLGNVVHPAVTYKSLNYNAFISIMLQGIKEQNSKNDNLETKTNNQDSIITSLQNQLNALASTINSCCDDKHDNGNHNGHQKAENNQTNVELNDAQTIVLEQNVPNPFAEQTAINYSLPDNTVKAQMLFYNAQGKLIQSTELTQKGKGQLNVFASDLSSGIYTYTLVVDGRIIETRKMVKQ